MVLVLIEWSGKGELSIAVYHSTETGPTITSEEESILKWVKRDTL